MSSQYRSSPKAAFCAPLHHTLKGGKKSKIYLRPVKENNLQSASPYLCSRRVEKKICFHITNTNRWGEKTMSEMSKSELNGSREQLEGSRGEMAWQYDFTITVVTVCVHTPVHTVSCRHAEQGNKWQYVLHSRLTAAKLRNDRNALAWTLKLK